jgi:UDP-N-acetylenolpyruvoylglucosamine reductase
LPIFLLGRGSNLLVRDGGFRGMVICLSHGSFARIEVEGQRLHCGAGAKLKTIAVEAKRHDLSGMEFLEGIPGSLGGGLRMNAGAMGGALFDVVESVRLMDYDGHAEQRASRELEVQYRCCHTLKRQIALGATLRGEPGLRELIQRRMQEYSQKRWNSQPAAPSAGCIFKNPPSIPAGQLVDELGLKGTRVGGAFVSAEHGNFIVNDGTATAQDVLDLIEIIRQRAHEARGIELETEVEIIGQ